MSGGFQFGTPNTTSATGAGTGIGGYAFGTPSFGTPSCTASGGLFGVAAMPAAGSGGSLFGASAQPSAPTATTTGYTFGVFIC